MSISSVISEDLVLDLVAVVKSLSPGVDRLESSVPAGLHLVLLTPLPQHHGLPLLLFLHSLLFTLVEGSLPILDVLLTEALVLIMLLNLLPLLPGQVSLVLSNVDVVDPLLLLEPVL